MTSNGADLLILHSAHMKPQGCRLQARRLITTCLPEGVNNQADQSWFLQVHVARYVAPGANQWCAPCLCSLDVWRLVWASSPF